MRIKNLANRLISLETVLVPPVAEPTVIILNAVDSNGVTRNRLRQLDLAAAAGTNRRAFQQRPFHFFNRASCAQNYFEPLFRVLAHYPKIGSWEAPKWLSATFASGYTESSCHPIGEVRGSWENQWILRHEGPPERPTAVSRIIR